MNTRTKIKEVQATVRAAVTCTPTIERIRAANVDLQGRIPAEIVELMSPAILSKHGWRITSHDDRCTICTKIEETRELELRLDRVNRRAVMLVMPKVMMVEPDDDNPFPVITRQRGEARNSAILSMI